MPLFAPAAVTLLKSFGAMIGFSLGLEAISGSIGMFERFATGATSGAEELKRLEKLARKNQRIAESGLISTEASLGRRARQQGLEQTVIGESAIAGLTSPRVINLLGALAQGTELPNQQSSSADDPDVITGAADEAAGGATVSEQEALISSTEMPQTPQRLLNPTPADVAAIKARLAVFNNPGVAQALA